MDSFEDSTPRLNQSGPDLDKSLNAILAQMHYLREQDRGPPSSPFFKDHLSPAEELAQLREQNYNMRMEAIHNENMIKEGVILLQNMVAEKEELKKTILKLQNEKFALYNENDDLKAAMKEVLPMKNELLEMKERAQVRDRQASSFISICNRYAATIDKLNGMCDEGLKNLYK